MNKKRITINDIKTIEKDYYRLPKIIIDNNLPGNAYKLYIKLYQITKLSIKNNWIDEDGSVYIKYTQSNASKLLNCSRNTIVKTFELLQQYQLIEIKDAGKHKVDKIYLLI